MVDKTHRDSMEDSSPDKKPQVASPSFVSYDAMQVMQTLNEIQGDLKSSITRTDRLIEDVKELSVDVRNINTTIAYFKGGAATAAVLLVLFAGLIYWLIGERLDDFRDEIISSKVVHSDNSVPAVSK